MHTALASRGGGLRAAHVRSCGQSSYLRWRRGINAVGRCSRLTHATCVRLRPLLPAPLLRLGAQVRARHRLKVSESRAAALHADNIQWEDRTESDVKTACGYVL